MDVSYGDLLGLQRCNYQAKWWKNNRLWKSSNLPSDEDETSESRVNTFQCIFIEGSLWGWRYPNSIHYVMFQNRATLSLMTAVGGKQRYLLGPSPNASPIVGASTLF